MIVTEVRTEFLTSLCAIMIFYIVYLFMIKET